MVEVSVRIRLCSNADVNEDFSLSLDRRLQSTEARRPRYAEVAFGDPEKGSGVVNSR